MWNDGYASYLEDAQVGLDLHAGDQWPVRLHDARDPAGNGYVPEALRTGGGADSGLSRTRLR